MPTATAIRTFRRNEKEIKPGDQFDCTPAEFAKWAGLGFIQPYEKKVTAPTATKKKSSEKPSPASAAAPASRKKTSKKRTKKAK